LTGDKRNLRLNRRAYPESNRGQSNQEKKNFARECGRQAVDLTGRLRQPWTAGVSLWGVLPMPLISHEIEGHDEERHAFRFSMLNDDQVFMCQISDAALDELAGAKGTESSARMEQFLALREKIEQTASQLFDEKPVLRGSVVRIFSKHVAVKSEVVSEGELGQGSE
jgi:hypothetical protein